MFLYVNLGGCTGRILLVIMWYTLEISHSHLEKRGHYQKPNSNTSNIELKCKGRKKKGCPAHIEVTQFDLYLDYNVHFQMSLNLCHKLASSQNQGREPEVLKTGFKTDRRCAGYSKILNHRGTGHHKCHPTKGFTESHLFSGLKQVILDQHRQNRYLTVPFGVHIHNLMLVFILK